MHNNNNYNNNNNEILFWKIFKNKYLLNLIINNLAVTDILNLDEINKYYIGNKFKINDVISLLILSEKKKFSILKDKLLSRDESYNQIELDGKKGIKSFILNCFDSTIIELIYKRYSIQFKSFLDIIYKSIKYENLNAFKIFITSESTEIIQIPPIINPKKVFKIIKNSDFIYIKLLLEYLNKPYYLNFYKEWIQKNVLKCSCSNIKCRDELVELLLLSENENNFITHSKLNNKIKFSQFILLKSYKNKKKLIFSNLVSFDNQYDSDDDDDYLSIFLDNINLNLLNLKELKLIYYLIFNKNEILWWDESKGSKRNKMNQLLLELSKYSYIIYLKYLIENDEILLNFKDQEETTSQIKINKYNKMIYIYTFSFFSINGLNYLILNNISNQDFIINKEYYLNFLNSNKDQILSNDPIKILNFFKYYFKSSNFKLVKFDLFKITIKFLFENLLNLEILKSIIQLFFFNLNHFLIIKNLNLNNSFLNYKLFMNFLIPLLLNNNIGNVEGDKGDEGCEQGEEDYGYKKKKVIIFKEFKFPFKIDSIDKIQFILNNIKFYENHSFQIESLELLKDYYSSKNEIFNIKNVPHCLIFNLFKLSIQECNLKLLKEFNEINFEMVDDDNQDIKFNENLKTNSIIQLFNQLKIINYNNLNFNNFISLLNGLKNFINLKEQQQQQQQQTEETNILINNLEINFKKFKISNEIQLNNYFISNLLNPIFIKILIKNQIITNETIFQDKSNLINIIDGEEINEKTLKLKNELIKFQIHLKPTIELLLNQFSNNKSIYSIFNKLYLIAMKSNDIEFNELIEMDNLFKIKFNIPIDNSCFHIFYSITIKYKCLKKYLLYLYSQIFRFTSFSKPLSFQVTYINEKLNYEFYSLENISKLNLNQLFLSFMDNLEIIKTTRVQPINGYQEQINYLIEMNHWSLIIESLKNSFQQQSYHTTKIHDYLLLNICKTIPIEFFLEFIEIFKFNNPTLNLKKLIEASIYSSRLNLVKFIFDNIDIQNSNINPQLYIGSYSNLISTNLISYLNSKESIIQINFNTSLFDFEFARGNIEICNLEIKKYWPNKDSTISFKDNTILSTFQNKNLFILKYYFEIGKLKKEDLILLKLLLIKYKKFKYLFWLFGW